MDAEYVQQHSLIEHRTSAREKLTQRDGEGSRCTQLADQRGADDGVLFSYQRADGCRDGRLFGEIRSYLAGPFRVLPKPLLAFKRRGPLNPR